MDLTITDTIYLAMAVRAMLEKDLSKADREAYEKIWCKLKVSHKGKKIRETFSSYMDEFRERIANEVH